MIVWDYEHVCQRPTRLALLVVALGVAAAVNFPLHNGDGRSRSYNAGWNFFAGSSAPAYQRVYGSMSCIGIFRMFHSDGPNDFTTYLLKSEWVHGCRDARVALRNAEQNATIPEKQPQ